MKWFLLILSFLLFDCYTIPPEYQLIQNIEDSWKNPKYLNFQPSNILVVAICKDLDSRKIFEDSFNQEFKLHGITSSSCKKIYDKQFSISLKSENELKKFNQKLLNDGFDAIFVTSIRGTNSPIDYKKDYYKIYHEWFRFDNCFVYNQDAYLLSNYYSIYNYYNLESSLYAVNCKSDKTLVWAGVIKIINPLKLNKQIQKQSESIINELEVKKIIPKKIS